MLGLAQNPGWICFNFALDLLILEILEVFHGITELLRLEGVYRIYSLMEARAAWLRPYPEGFECL